MSNTTILDTLGISVGTFKEVNIEPSTGGFLLESGMYKVEIKELAVFETERKARMVKIEMFDPETEKTFTEYINTSYINKESKEVTENKGGASIFKALLSAIALEPAQAQIEEKEIDAYGKKVNGQVIKNAEGRTCYALVREVEDPNNEKYPSSNQVEGFADVEKQIGGSTEPVEKWLAKIEKAPVKILKSKGGNKAATPKAEDTKAAISLLD